MLKGYHYAAHLYYKNAMVHDDIHGWMMMLCVVCGVNLGLFFLSTSGRKLEGGSLHTSQKWCDQSVGLCC